MKALGEQWHIDSGIRGRILVKDAWGETLAELLAKALAVRISAVPEMLEALEWVASQQHLFFSEGSQAEEIVVRCRAATRKAGGGRRA
jgi:hypothetical protein